jgi:hypothetical protein
MLNEGELMIDRNRCKNQPKRHRASTGTEMSSLDAAEIISAAS